MSRSDSVRETYTVREARSGGEEAAGDKGHRRIAWVTFVVGLAASAALLWHYSHANSAIFDEGMHISAGYRYWEGGDYGINPEHPPLVKLEATLQLRHWELGNDVMAWGCSTTTCTPVVNFFRRVRMHG